ncbi:1,4-beta-xylanase [Lentisphaerota bacterium WC36G]|nr:glycoside hydrolase family 5 protein [Lentisphaerae bacterium WC36]
MKRFLLTGAFVATLALFANQTKAVDNEVPKTKVWSLEKAKAWQKKQGWIIGCNFIPSNASNQLEMWQKATYSPKLIDKELGWAASIGFNTVRVYLHDLVWATEKEAFLARIDNFLTICAKHKIKPMFVFFDDCWNPVAKAGPQPDPIPRLHNAGWVQSPARGVRDDYKKIDKLEEYVLAVLKRFKDDDRIRLWDLYNEPGNFNRNSYKKYELKDKRERTTYLLKKVYQWADKVELSQPVTSGTWASIKSNGLLNRIAYNCSDVISFHNYSGVKKMEEDIKFLQNFKRPIICSEYMARPSSTFAKITPIMKKYKLIGD